MATITITSGSWAVDATLTIGVGVPGPQGIQGIPGPQGVKGDKGDQGEPGIGIAAGGITGQLLAKASNLSYDTAWTTVIPGDRYLSTSSSTLTIGNGARTLTVGTGLSYSATQDITVALTSDPNNYHMHGKVTSYNSGTGVLVVDVQNHTGAGTFSAWTVNVGGLSPVTSLAWGNITGTLSAQTDLQTALDGKYSTSNPAGYITSSALTPYLLSSTAASTYYPLTNPSAYITSSALSPYLLSSTAASTYQTQSGMSSYLTISSAASTYYPLSNPSGYITSSALTPYAPLAGATFTGDVSITANTVKKITVDFPLVGRKTTIGAQSIEVGYSDGYTADTRIGGDIIQVGRGTTGFVVIEADSQAWTQPYIQISNYLGTETYIQNGQFLADTGSGRIEPYARLSGAAFTGPVTNSTSTFTARRFIGQPNGGVAAFNIGVGGDQTNSTTNGDLWIATGGTSLNFRDGTGSWRQCLTTSQVGIIDVSSATAPALRVTQRGAGEAFRVEDSTTPDATAFVIDANGKVGVGVAPDSTAAINVDANGVRWSTGGATIQQVAAPASGSGTYNLEMQVVINGTSYRFPCRQA